MSPYEKIPKSKWKEITEKIIQEHPLDMKDIIDSVFESWDGILRTKIAGELQIGKDIFPSPQILGNYLHELIPVFLSRKFKDKWRKEQDKSDKDLVYIPNNYYSIEIKTSSNATNIYGNRSYGQKNSVNNSGKSKDGYYLTVNFEKFDSKNPEFTPSIRKIRFGWIDHSDWRSQASSTGQQASLDIDARDKKLKLLYDKNDKVR